jgi:cytochrome c oxidase subunit 1
MTMFRMPLFTWTILVTSLLVLLATPVFTSALVMLLIDRNLGGSFFNPANGGIAVLWQNVFWFYSHPAVYVMVLPGMGIISDVLPVFSRKPLFGYKAFVFATAGIGALGFSVWAHHMFVTGQVLLPFFSIMTFLIAVPTGVKFFNWIATLVKGQITFSTAMLFAIGFLTMFLIGGIDGVFLASPPVDFALTETYWVVAHIHYVLFGGSVFAVYAGFYYWFPKFSGKKLKEGLGKLHFWLQFIGFNLTFFSMHILGLLGMPRRIQDYAPLKDWVGLNQLQTAGRPAHRPVHGAVPGQRGDDPAPQGPGPGGSLGGQHPGVVHLLPAAGAQLRQPARDPLRAAPVRPAPRRRAHRPSRRHLHRSPLMAVVDSAALDEVPAAEHHKPGGISSSLLGMVLFIASR